MRPAEVAEKLSCSVKTVYAAIARNQIPALRMPGGRTLMVPRAWLENLPADTIEQWFEYLGTRGFTVPKEDE